MRQQNNTYPKDIERKYLPYQEVICVTLFFFASHNSAKISFIAETLSYMLPNILYWQQTGSHGLCYPHWCLPTIPPSCSITLSLKQTSSVNKQLSIDS